MEEGRNRVKSNFALAFFVLPKKQRTALQALYQYCRTVDDIVDEAVDPSSAQAQLDHWREILDRLPNSSLFDPPQANALGKACQNFPIQKSDLLWILEGVEMDLKKFRYQTFEELLAYCDAVASAVGLASLAVFGADRQRTMKYALATGRALQLTNILRDLASDARRGRIYIPLEELQRFSYPEQHLMMSIYNDKFMELMQFQVSRVKEFYQASKAALPLKERKFFPAAEIMRETYELILQRIAAKKYNIFPRKIRVSTARKASVAMSIWASQLFRKAS